MHVCDHTQGIKEVLLAAPHPELMVAKGVKDMGPSFAQQAQSPLQDVEIIRYIPCSMQTLVTGHCEETARWSSAACFSPATMRVSSW